MFKFNFKNKKGFSLLEIVLAVAIFSAGAISTGYLVIDANKTTDINTKKIAATFLAKEGIEALRFIRDANSGGFNNLTPGSWGLSFDGTSWILSSDPDTSTDNVYTRAVTITLDGSDPTHIKNVTSTVTALSGGRTVSVSLTTKFTSWR